jgi:hypothetical protein
MKTFNIKAHRQIARFSTENEKGYKKVTLYAPRTSGEAHVMTEVVNGKRTRIMALSERQYTAMHVFGHTVDEMLAAAMLNQ